jgi:hypothetical protein
LCFDHTQSYTIQTRFSYQLVWHENYDGYADSEDINLDWMDKMPEELTEISLSSEPTEPEGVRVQVLSDGERRAMYNVKPFGGAVSMEPGEYSLLFYNNDTENVIFSEDYSMAETITATTRTIHMWRTTMNIPSQSLTCCSVNMWIRSVRRILDTTIRWSLTCDRWSSPIS